MARVTNVLPAVQSTETGFLQCAAALDVGAQPRILGVEQPRACLDGAVVSACDVHTVYSAESGSHGEHCVQVRGGCHRAGDPGITGTMPSHPTGLPAITVLTFNHLVRQLCISHYDKPFVEKELSKKGWLRRQTEVCKDVTCPAWHDWFHGGLNLHRVHHLMPRLSRCQYRQVLTQRIVLVCIVCILHMAGMLLSIIVDADAD